MCLNQFDCNDHGECY